LSRGGDVACDGGGLVVRMTVGPQLGIAVTHPEVAGLALVLAGGAGCDGLEERPGDITGGTYQRGATPVSMSSTGRLVSATTAWPARIWTWRDDGRASTR